MSFVIYRELLDLQRHFWFILNITYLVNLFAISYILSLMVKLDVSPSEASMLL